MSIVSKTYLKTKFETGDKPTQQDFTDFIDSAVFFGSAQTSAGTFGLQMLATETTAQANDLLGINLPAFSTFGKAVASAATTAAGQNVLGIGTVGRQVFEAGTTAVAQDALGGGTVGKQLFEAATTAAAQAIIGTSSFMGCWVTKSADQSFPSGSQDTVTWNQEVYDVGGFHDTVTNNASFTIPAAANNKYARFTFQASWQSAGVTGYRYILLTKNSANSSPLIQGSMPPVNGTDTVLSFVSPPILVSAGDQYQVVGLQTQSSAINLRSIGSFFAIEVLP